MQKDYPPLHPRFNPSLVTRINEARGHADLLELLASRRRAEADEFVALAVIELQNQEKA